METKEDFIEEWIKDRDGIKKVRLTSDDVIFPTGYTIADNYVEFTLDNRVLGIFAIKNISHIENSSRKKVYAVFEIFKHGAVETKILQKVFTNKEDAEKYKNTLETYYVTSKTKHNAFYYVVEGVEVD